MKSMRLVVFLALAGCLLMAASTVQEKAKQMAPPGPTVVDQGKLSLALKAGEYDLMTVVMDFAKGAGVPNHKHGGYVLVTVLSGELTVKQEGGEKVIKAGESWTENPGMVHSVVNNGQAVARLVANFLIPKGAEQTTVIK